MWLGVPKCLGVHEIAIAHGVGGGRSEKVINSPRHSSFRRWFEPFPCYAASRESLDHAADSCRR